MSIYMFVFLYLHVPLGVEVGSGSCSRKKVEHKEMMQHFQIPQKQCHENLFI